jgi:hypothetical protein
VSIARTQPAPFASGVVLELLQQGRGSAILDGAFGKRRLQTLSGKSQILACPIVHVKRISDSREQNVSQDDTVVSIVHRIIQFRILRFQKPRYTVSQQLNVGLVVHNKTFFHNALVRRRSKLSGEENEVMVLETLDATWLEDLNSSV